MWGPGEPIWVLEIEGDVCRGGILGAWREGLVNNRGRCVSRRGDGVCISAEEKLMTEKRIRGGEDTPRIWPPSGGPAGRVEIGGQNHGGGLALAGVRGTLGMELWVGPSLRAASPG